MVGVDTDAHWVAFTGDNFASANNASAGVYGIVDGVLLPLGSVRVRDDKLVEVLVPAALGCAPCMCVCARVCVCGGRARVCVVGVHV